MDVSIQSTEDSRVCSRIPRHTALKVKHLGYFTFPQELDNNQHKETIQATVRYFVHQPASHHRTVLGTGGNVLSPDRAQHLHSRWNLITTSSAKEGKDLSAKTPRLSWKCPLWGQIIENFPTNTDCTERC